MVVLLLDSVLQSFNFTLCLYPNTDSKPRCWMETRRPVWHKRIFI